MTTELAYTYNDYGLPVKLTYTDVDGETRTVREETNLTYDGNGNILTEAVTEAYSGSTTKTRTYQYDLGNRLISAAYDGTTTTYTYDAVGNRLTRQEGTETAETYTYNYLNQLTRVQQGTAVTTYTYDARGNQTQQVQTGTGVTTTTNYGYDLANRLTSTNISNNAVIPLSTSATYAYNAQGQRVTRVEDGVVTHFYYTGSALLFTTVNEYVLQTQNILDPSGTIVASKRFEGQAATGQDPYAEDYFFYRYDIRGSVTTIVDGEGAVVKSYDYDEFGVTTASGDAFFNEVTFTGSISDASGLLYMNARYYNPTTARFLSQDSYTGSAFDPWTQHPYAYCNNNALTALDVSQNTALTNLYCSDNALTALDVTKNTALTRLYCYNNALTALDVTQNTALTYLDCNNNALTALDLSQNTKLTYLDCSGQQAAETRVLQQADGSGRADLSGLVPGWSRAQGVQVQGGTLEADGSTVVWDGKTSPVTVSYAYRTGYQAVTMDAMLHVYFDSGSRPVFTQPAGAQTVTVAAGQTGTLRAAATDALVYQWYVNRNDGAGYVAVSGATGATYTTSAATVENDGYTYYCEATNAFGTTSSPVFTLRVTAEPVPETGDGSDPALWLTLALVSLCGLGALTFGRRRGAARR